MQVASHPQTGWTIDQMMNKPFESKGKITTDKNKAKNASIFFSVLHGTWGFAKTYPETSTSEILRKLMKFLSKEALETS